MSMTTPITEATEDEAVPTVTVFSKNNCSICVATEAKLTERGIPFRDINVEEDTEPRAEFNNLTPFDYVVRYYGRSMPVVVVDSGVWGDHWTGRRFDKMFDLIQLFEKLGATIPEADRVATKPRI
jgi:glutaredoxin